MHTLPQAALNLTSSLYAFKGQLQLASMASPAASQNQELWQGILHGMRYISYKYTILQYNYTYIYIVFIKYMI